MARSSRSSPFRFSVLSRPHTPTSPGDARAREAHTVFVKKAPEGVNVNAT